MGNPWWNKRRCTQCDCKLFNRVDGKDSDICTDCLDWECDFGPGRITPWIALDGRV